MSKQLHQWSGSTCISPMMINECEFCVIAVSSFCVSLQAIEKAFDSSVKALCQTKVLECPEVSQEMCLLKISAAFGHLAVKSCPNLRRQISHAMNEFITRNLGGWITEQGGWVG